MWILLIWIGVKLSMPPLYWVVFVLSVLVHVERNRFNNMDE